MSARPGYSYLLRGLLLRLFYTLEDKTSFHCNFMRLDSSNEDFLFARISNCLEESHGNISRPELSRALHYNAEYLNQIVKRRTGASLLKLAGQYRLDHARQLLTKTDKSVTAIVEELGFTGTSHFYNLFRRETGMSPLEYREKIHKNTAHRRYPFCIAAVFFISDKYLLISCFHLRHALMGSLPGFRL